MKTSDETFKIHGENFSYKLIRSKKRKKSLALKINKQGTVQVNVPFKTSVKVIEDFIITKFDWIKLKVSANLLKRAIKPLSYTCGSKHYYLGDEYTLKLISTKNSRIELKNDVILVYHRANVSIKNILDKWYKQESLVLFTHRTDLFMTQFKLPKVKNIKVRNMKARWGSCNNKAEITYNIHLVKAKPECIDYVVIHELCHLIHANHGAGFYRLQSKLNPFYKQHKKLLNDEGHQFIQA